MVRSVLSKGTVLFLFLLLSAGSILAQKDSLVLKNGNVIVGEIKSLDKGVLTIKTVYSKNDFVIKWGGVMEIYSTTAFLTTLKDGSRVNARLQSQADGKILLTDQQGKQTEAIFDDIVYLKGLKSDFWSRVHANIDLGLSVTKANNLRQYSMRSSAGYLADRWQADIHYNDIRSKQDNVEATQRTEAGTSFTYILPKDWFAAAALSTLSNTEQALDLRITAKAGVGKFLVHTNKAYFGVGTGLSYNNETFTNGTPGRSSLEGYVGTNANLFDIGDFSLLGDLYVYPSFTESGRWRVDFSMDTKYNLPLDLYLKLGVTLNYDNRPAATGKETDYVYVFSVGWELK